MHINHMDMPKIIHSFLIFSVSTKNFTKSRFNCNFIYSNPHIVNGKIIVVVFQVVSINHDFFAISLHFLRWFRTLLQRRAWRRMPADGYNMERGKTTCTSFR